MVEKLRNIGLRLQQTESSQALSEEKTLENLWRLGLLCFQFAPPGFTATTAASPVPSVCTATVPVTTCPDTATACQASQAHSATKVPPLPPPFWVSVTLHWVPSHGSCLFPLFFSSLDPKKIFASEGKCKQVLSHPLVNMMCSWFHK